MLILSRKVKEAVIIAGNVRVSILGQKKNGDIVLGIDAPPGVRVDREEVHAHREAERLAAEGDAA